MSNSAAVKFDNGDTKVVSLTAVTLALILSRKLSFLNKICVTTVIIERYDLQNDSGCHLNDA